MPDADPVRIPHAIQGRNREPLVVYGTTDGRWVCPICGALLSGPPPYDPATHKPSYAWCTCCEFQFGWDDLVPTDAPLGAQTVKWAELREQWLRAGVTADEAEAQLRHLMPTSSEDPNPNL